VGSVTVAKTVLVAILWGDNMQKCHWLEIDDLPEPDRYDGGDRMAKAIEDRLRMALGEPKWQWLCEKEVSDEYRDKLLNYQG